MSRLTLACVVSLCASTAAAAEPHREDVEPAREPSNARVARDRASAAQAPESGAAEAAAAGALSPFSLSPSVPRVATGLALAGYDGASSAFRARSAVDGRLASFLAARVEYDHGPANGPSDRVSLGLRAAFLNQAAHGVDLGAMAFYQPRDFRDEGNVMLGVLLSRRIERFTLVLNPMVGSDPEGDDASFELRLAALYKANSSLVLGLDSRARYNFSEDEKRAGHTVIDWDAQGGASAAFGFGPVLLSLLVGPSFIQRTAFDLDATAGERQRKAGLLALVGGGASF